MTLSVILPPSVDTIPPGFFRSETTGIRRLEKARQIAPTLVDRYEADARANSVTSVLVDEPIHFYQLTDLLCDSFRILLRTRIKQDPEFITTKPGYGIARANTVPQPPSHLLQQLVASSMPACIVHDLELIKIDI